MNTPGITPVYTLNLTPADLKTDWQQWIASGWKAGASVETMAKQSNLRIGDISHWRAQMFLPDRNHKGEVINKVTSNPFKIE